MLVDFATIKNCRTVAPTKYTFKVVEEKPVAQPQQSSNKAKETSSYGFQSGAFPTQQNFQIPEDIRDFLSKPPSWINMENW